MVVPAQYPHDLYILTTSGGSVNADGDIVPATQQWINVCRCREEKKSGSAVYMNSGTQFEYSSKIFTPTTCPNLEKGASFEVRNGSEVRAKGTVKLFDASVNHCRIWV
jgi:hypothetical protein